MANWGKRLSKLAQSGTSLPGSPTTNDLFFHETDAELYFYDGAQWLSVAQYHLAISMTNAALLTGISANGEHGYATIPYKGTDLIYIEEFRCTTYVSTTNTGAAFWTVSFGEYDDGAPASSILATATTAADSPGQYNMKAVVEDAAIPSDSMVLFISATKTGAPGSLFLQGAEIVFRRIGS